MSALSEGGRKARGTDLRRDILEKNQTEENDDMNNRQSWNMITLFAVLIFGFSAATLLKPQRSFSERENRVLATRPDPSVRSVLSGEFEKDYEDSLTDQFVLRDKWIALHTMAERAVLKQDIHDVYLGKDHYLIEKHTGTFSSVYAENNIRMLADFANRCTQEYGAEHVAVMIVPNAVEVLRDKLPPYAPQDEGTAYRERIRSILPEEIWVDAAGAIFDTSRQAEVGQLYYRTDHHWTTGGAFLAFQELAAHFGLDCGEVSDWQRIVLTDRFEGTVAARTGSSGIYDTIEYWQRQDRPQVRCAIRCSGTDEVRYDLLQRQYLDTRDKYAVFFGGNYGLTEIHTDADSSRRLLVVKDSYAHCFIPFLLDQFSQVDMVDVRYFNQSLQEYMQKGGYTDVLFLYNTAGFAEDASLVKIGS